MGYQRASRVTRDEQLPEQDDSRPTITPRRPSYAVMLNTCRECGKYRYVYCQVDLHDGRGPGYVCGGCLKQARETYREKAKRSA